MGLTELWEWGKARVAHLVEEQQERDTVGHVLPPLEEEKPLTFGDLEAGHQEDDLPEVGEDL